MHGYSLPRNDRTKVSLRYAFMKCYVIRFIAVYVSVFITYIYKKRLDDNGYIIIFLIVKSNLLDCDIYNVNLLYSQIVC